MSVAHLSYHSALVLESEEAGFRIKELAIPSADHGSAVVRILAAAVLSYHREIYNGQRNYHFPKPLVGGASAVGRIAIISADAVSLQPGQLVYVDCVMRGRDDPDAIFLSAIHEGGTDGSRKLMTDVWRDGTFAEYAKVPLENCIPLNEPRLCRELGYSVQDLAYIAHLIVPFGGLRDIRIEPGETVIICPATGGYGGAAVQVAVALGARVIAMGRSEKELERMKYHVKSGTPNASIETVKITGDLEGDTTALQAFGAIDAVLDCSPPVASKSSHLRSALSALRRNGRCSAMGFSEQPIIDWNFVGRNITVKGKLMYEREDILQFVKMLREVFFPGARILCM